MIDNKQASFFSKWQSRGAFSTLIFCLYFIPLMAAFLIFASFPEDSRQVLAFFSLVACACGTSIIYTFRKLLKDQHRTEEPMQKPQQYEAHIHEVPDDNAETSQSQKNADCGADLQKELALIDQLNNEIHLQNQQITRLQEEKQAILTDSQGPLQETQKLVHELKAANIASQNEIVSLKDELIEKNRLIASSDDIASKLKKELDNTRFELETLLKLEVHTASREEAYPQMPFERKTPVVPPSLFSPPKSLTNSLTRSLNAMPESEVSITSIKSLILHNCDKALEQLLEKTRELSQTCRTPGEQLELPAFLDLSIDTLAIEKRRLIDTLKQEPSLPSLIINCQDAKVIFVSPSIKKLTGIDPERFQKEFFQLVGSSKEHIKNALALLKPSERTKIPIQISLPSHADIQAILAIGVCPLPPFSRSAIGILEITSA